MSFRSATSALLRAASQGTSAAASIHQPARAAATGGATILGPRLFHASSYPQSHVGSLPLPIPSGVSLTLPEDLALPASLPPTSSRSRRHINVSGPLGAQSLSIPPCTIIHPPTEENGRILTVAVRDAEVKEQKALWGLTRALLANAVTGVSEGYRLTLRLVGVGYRGAVEPIPDALKRVMLLNYGRRVASGGANTTSNSSSNDASSEVSLPTQRLNLKLGYAHPIYVEIPPGITVTTPQPTRIVLQGIDKQKLGLFAEKIRRWRKPEPYRGKGIFVGDETIKLKEIKKK